MGRAKRVSSIAALVATLSLLLSVLPPIIGEETPAHAMSGMTEAEFMQEFGVPMWVDTSSWPALTTNVHRCYERHHLNTIVDEGFGTDNSGNPYTSTAETGTAAHSLHIQDGLGRDLGAGTFPNGSLQTWETNFGALINEVSTTNNWNGDPSALLNAISSARSADNSTTFAGNLSPDQKDVFEKGGVINVVETRREGRIAASNDEQDLIQVRGYDCGMDYRRTNDSGNTVTGTIWFLSENERNRSANPHDSYALDADQVGMARYDAMKSFDTRDVVHGQQFARYFGLNDGTRGLSEGWRTSKCRYTDEIYWNVDRNGNAYPTRHLVGSNGELSQSGTQNCGIRLHNQPDISHQMPYTEIGMIVWSYRFQNPENGRYHSLQQQRQAGDRPDANGNGNHNSIWHNEAPASHYLGDRLPFFPGEPGFDESEGLYTESIAHSERFDSHIPHKAFQVMHVVCNKDGVDDVLAGTSGAATHNSTDRDYSSLVVSRSYDGASIPSGPNNGPDFGRTSGNDSEHRDFYTKECEFDPEEVSNGEHTVSNPNSSGTGAERFGSDNPGSNQIAMMRDNVPSTVIFDVQDNPTISSSHIANAAPAYTLMSKSSGSSLDNLGLFNFEIAGDAGDDDNEVFGGSSAGPLNLTNNPDNLPDEHFSSTIELRHGFVDSFRVSSPWVSDHGNPEAFTISYAWKADLMSHIPNAVVGGSSGNGINDKIRSTESVIIPVIARSHADMGGTGEPSLIASVSDTSGADTDISNLDIDDMDRYSSNSLVFDFIRSVSER